MKMWQYFFVLKLLTILVVQRVNSKSCNSSTYGTEFYFGILEAIDYCCHDERNKVIVDITNVSPNPTEVRVKIPFSNFNRLYTIPVGTRRSIDVDPLIQHGGIFVLERGIRVSSNSSVSVMVTNAFNSGNTIDSYNVLPVNRVGNDYIIASYTNANTARGSEILVAGIYNNTNVTLYDASTVVYTTKLDPYDVFQYRYGSANRDMTGFRLKADKNVAVVSGASFIEIPDDVSHFNFIASELYPINTWSNAFIVPPVLSVGRFILRLQSNIATNIHLSYDMGNGLRTKTVSSSTSDHEFGSSPVSIIADRPLMVSQFGYGAPFMTIVPSIKQYVNDLKFSVPDELYSAKPYMTIIVPKNYSSDLRLDSNRILSNVTSITEHQVPSPFDNYTVLSFPTTSGFHHIYHPMEDARFCVLVLGIGNGLSYGFFPGFNLDGECPKPEPTTNPPSTMVTASYQTTHYWGNSSGDQFLQCYTCEDMTHIELCDTIKQCGLHEVCFLERYTLSGRYVYKSGCLAQNVCTHQQQIQSSDICVECCHGDFCNNKGCGDSGLPDRPHRGPVCFDCQHVFSPDECTTVTMCDPSQVCIIEQFPWGDHSHFKMGCAYELCDPLKRSVLNIEERATPVCHSCCEADYCNRNCTIIKNGPNIVG